MSDSKPSLFFRLGLAFRAFVGILGDPTFAAAVWRLRHETQGAAPAPAPGALQDTNPDSALQLLALFQRHGRLIDFLQEEVAQYSDAEVGAAVRVVHEGCRKVLREDFVIEPVLAEHEGAAITLNPGFDASAIRPTGNLVGEPPFNGSLAHCGWRAKEVKLPKLAVGHDATVLAPAEVEL
jgi:hypothetical protein